LGAERAQSLNLPDIYPWRLAVEVLIDRLRELGAYRRVYTHSPFEAHPHHRDVALAASRCFEEIWVSSCGGYAAEPHVLDRHAYQRKLDIVNSVYPRELALADADPQRSVADMLAGIPGLEAFVPTRWREVIQALALTRPEMRVDLPNTWAFEVSPYEVERYDRTCEVLAQACKERPPGLILELGAYEGAMTLRLRGLFPNARICAVEPNPVFVRRLRERLGHELNIDIAEASILDVPLSADLIVMAEMLYYVPESVMDVLSRARASYLLTSYHGAFDARLCHGLHALGWREIASAEVLPKFEPVDGGSSLLMARRPGSHIRLWGPA
jgi:hypothetical protein